MRQCKLGDLRWLAKVSRPDVCAWLAQSAAKAKTPPSSDIYRINDLIKTAKERQ